MIVTEDLTLEPDAVLREPLVIGADGVTVDGRGATIRGPGEPGDCEALAGVGVLAEGRSGITIRNLKVRGFECGLVARDGRDWLIERCDFSDNYHDPDFGWGDGERNGGIILTGICGSVIRDNRACRVWNGLDLWACHDNLVENNIFSHCSNVCLKLWASCRNRVLDNDLSRGLRLKPGEVHARDSAGVLIEAGSDGNRFERNDVRHGGDGIFLRPLNGWVSTGNVFVENDCSYANNNGFESWSPGNTFLRNRADHCSHGFWMGGSAATVLVGNEASHNGLPTGRHNAPESDFGHGGIVIVGWEANHCVIDANRCCGNNGAGIVFRGDVASRGARWKMRNYVVQNNVLADNKWGLFCRYADGLFLANNTFRGNRQDELLEGVTNLRRGRADPHAAKPPVVALAGPSRAAVGQAVTFDASASTEPLGRELTCHWAVDGTAYTTPTVEHVFREPGFHRVCLTATNGFLAGSAFRDLYVIRPVREFATEGHASRWGWETGDNGDGRGKVTFTDDASVAIVGRTSLRMRADPYTGADVSAVFPASRDAGWDLSDKTHLAFWLGFRNASSEGFRGPCPVVGLHAKDAAFTYLPVEDGEPIDLLRRPPHAEARYGWLYVRVPLAGGDGWTRTGPPAAPAAADYLALQFQSKGTAPFEIHLDGLTFE